MNKNPIDRLILLLAAMDFTPSELRYLLEELQSIPPKMLVNRVNEMQDMHPPMGYVRTDSDRSISNVRMAHASDLTVVD